MQTTTNTTKQTIEAMYNLAKTNQAYASAEAAKAPKASHVVLTMYAPKGATWANAATSATLEGKVWVVKGQGVYYYPSNRALTNAPSAPVVAKEVAHDSLYNEGGEGYNPYRKSASQTYRKSESSQYKSLFRGKKYKNWA